MDMEQNEGKSNLLMLILYSPIARSAIYGESLVCIKKSLELASRYVIVLYRMHSSQSVQRMHHLQGHWF